MMFRKLISLGVACAALMLPSAAAAEWRAAETRHFIIYSESSEKDIEELAERLEKYDGLMRMATAIRDDVEPVKVRIYEVPNTDHVERALGLSDTGIVGFYSSNIMGPFAVTPRKTFIQTGKFGPDLVLHHEYAHHFMLQYFPSTYPQWYVEGFAELIGSSKVMKDGRIGYGMPAVQRGNDLLADWVSLEELMTKPAHKIYNFDLYGQGWAVTHFLTFSSERAPQLRAYLQALRAGKSMEEAAKAFGDLRELNRDARRYVQSGSFEYKPVPVEIERPVIQKIRPLSGGEAALIPEVLAFNDEDVSSYRKEKDRQNELKRREQNLERIRDKARRYAGDPFALYLLGEAEFAAGNYREAEAAADALLAVRPNHVRGLVRKSLTLATAAGKLEGAARDAKAKEARALAMRANKADVNDPLPLLAYYQSFNLAGERAPDQAVEGLMAVVQTLPDYTTARRLLVDALADRKRYIEAIAYIQPLANSPHESPLRDAAREKLAELIAAWEAQQTRRKAS